MLLECPYCYGRPADNNKADFQRKSTYINGSNDYRGIKKFIFAGYATDPLNCSYIEDFKANNTK